ncbi:hypothetical protein HPB47_011629 [Ixodes persulcatus]|uniref:Uncharacterized protein n=1 Tax=Ixodes persulcatus TaxID=34615 RepID=A0AC60NVV5_IXOPE|nr:hypothetical protein HPB47_011629 [Ixodes persulcatus]
MHAIATATRLTPTETNDTMVRPKPQQNLITVLTFRQSARDKLLNTTTISIQEKPYQITAYEAASTQTCKGVIHGIERGTPSDVLMRHLITTGAPILTARMMGQSLSAIITFEGTYVPYYVLYQQAEYRCRPHRPKAQICQRCHGIGHRADICTIQTTPPFICEKCSTYLEEQNQPHDCDPKCKNCGGEHCRDASCILEAPPNPTGHNTTPTRSAKIDDPARKISVQEPDEVSFENTGIEKATLASTSMVKSPHIATPNLRAKSTSHLPGPSTHSSPITTSPSYRNALAPSPIPSDIPQTIPELFHFINNKLDRMMSILQDHSHRIEALEQAIQSRPRKIPNRVIEQQDTFIPDQSMDSQCRDADNDEWLAPPTGTDIPTALEALINHSGPLAESICETWAGRAVRTRT